MQAQYPPHPGYMPPQYPQFPSMPSAHLEGTGGGLDCPNERTITYWNPSDPKSHVLGGFQYNNGVLTVPYTGRYYVYAQIYFCSRPSLSKNRVSVMAGNRCLLMINKDLTGGSIEETGTAGGVFVLSAGEQISVKPAPYDTKLYFGPNHCYFGAYMVSA